MTDRSDQTNGFDEPDLRADVPVLAPADDAFVRSLLHAMPDDLPPVTMPADVAARIDAALAAESAARTGGAGTAGASSAPLVPGSATVVPLDEARTARNRRATRLLGAAAIFVAVVGGGVFAVKSLGGNTTGSGGSAAASPAQVTHSTHTYTDQQLATDVAMLAEHEIPPSADQRSATGESTSPSLTPSSGSPSSVTSSPTGSATQTPSPTSSTFGAPTPNPTSYAAMDTLFTSDATLIPCLAALEEGLTAAVDPIAMDVGTYAGQPAMVVVLPNSVDPAGAYDVFVVGASCGTDEDAHLLHYAKVPRP